MHSEFYCIDLPLNRFHWIISKLSSAKDREWGGGGKKDNLTYFYRIGRDMVIMVATNAKIV